jgi:Flp pilus assembly pilin Flp
MLQRSSIFPKHRSRGAALLEYGLLLGLISVVAVGSVSGLGKKVEEAFSGTGNVLSETMASAGSAAVDEAPEGGETPEPQGWQPHPDATYVFRITAGDLNEVDNYGTGYARWTGDGKIDDLSEHKHITALYTNPTGATSYLFTQAKDNLIDDTSVIRCDGGPFYTLDYVTMSSSDKGTQWQVKPGPFPISIGDTLECEVFYSGVPDDLK